MKTLFQQSRFLLGGVFACIIGVTSVQIYCAWKMELLPDEAYYWTYSRHPALSYFDHPPMVAWLISAGTAVAGDTELGVRLATLALSIGSRLLLFLTARIWFGKTAALRAVIIFTLLPVFGGLGVIATPDGPLIFFWLLTLFAFSHVLHAAPARATLFWLLTGIAFGCALLSKYPAIFLAPSVLLFLLCSPTQRRWLWRPQPWAALVVALMVFSPVLLWNAMHDFASFRFHLSRVVAHRNFVISVGEFWLLQIGILTPPLFVLFALTAGRAVRLGWLGGEDRWNFAASFSLPLFLLFLTTSFKSKVNSNWTAPAFISLAIAAAFFYGEKLTGQQVRATRWRAAGWAAVFTCAGVFVAAVYNANWGIPFLLTADHAEGWRELAERVETAETELNSRTGKKPFVLGIDKWSDIAAEIGFYQRKPQEQVNRFALGSLGFGYRYWTDLSAFEEYPAVAVLQHTNAQIVSDLKMHFDKLDPAVSIEVATLGGRTRTFDLIDCYGYSAAPRLRR